MKSQRNRPKFWSQFLPFRIADLGPTDNLSHSNLYDRYYPDVMEDGMDASIDCKLTYIISKF